MHHRWGPREENAGTGTYRVIPNQRAHRWTLSHQTRHANLGRPPGLPGGFTRNSGLCIAGIWKRQIPRPYNLCDTRSLACPFSAVPVLIGRAVALALALWLSTLLGGGQS